MVKFETRPPNLNKEGGINQRVLLRTALRMRPDRIIVGECRGAEALDMLQAMNTGVEGSMSTVHANSPRDAFSRLETMVMMADLEIPTAGDSAAARVAPSSWWCRFRVCRTARVRS